MFLHRHWKHSTPSTSFNCNYKKVNACKSAASNCAHFIAQDALEKKHFRRENPLSCSTWHQKHTESLGGRHVLAPFDERKGNCTFTKVPITIKQLGARFSSMPPGVTSCCPLLGLSSSHFSSDLIWFPDCNQNGVSLLHDKQKEIVFWHKPKTFTKLWSCTKCHFIMLCISMFQFVMISK